MQSEVITFRTAGSVLFGNNAVEKLGSISAQLAAKRALIVTDKGIVKSGLLDRLKQCVAGLAHEVYDDIDHTPSFETIRRCTRFATCFGVSSLPRALASNSRFVDCKDGPDGFGVLRQRESGAGRGPRRMDGDRSGTRRGSGWQWGVY